MCLRCLDTSIFIETPSLKGLPTKPKEDPSPHEKRLSPAGHQPSISWSRENYYYYYYFYYHYHHHYFFIMVIRGRIWLEISIVYEFLFIFYSNFDFFSSFLFIIIWAAAVFIQSKWHQLRMLKHLKKLFSNFRCPLNYWLNAYLFM